MPNTEAASNAALAGGEKRLISAVIRMFAALRSASTAPSMASQRNRAEDSSSTQTSGLWNT